MLHNLKNVNCVFFELNFFENPRKYFLNLKEKVNHKKREARESSTLLPQNNLTKKLSIFFNFTLPFKSTSVILLEI